MADKPTYEELEESVKQLEKEVLSLRRFILICPQAVMLN